ncbi:MAG TPA: PLP-dependent aminotransferase family protein [Candidatus Acidoferrales bacterium]|nr:PLP-dependent aminotransferase family protein [Candidatus Acidoferrales bacterium]
MRSPKGMLLPRIRAARVRRGNLYQTLRAAVLEGAFRPGQRFPSSRQAAADYGISRGLVEEVFTQLTDEGFLERGVGRGTFIASRVAQLTPAKGKKKRKRSPSPSRRGLAISANAACREPEIPVAFNAGTADIKEFPWERWRLLEARAARELGHEGLRFTDPRGLWSLRTAVARYVAQFRGMHCEPGQVIVFNSAQQALNAISILLLDRGDAAWMEDPGYLGARAAFGIAGARIVPVPVDDQGMRVDMGMRCSPRARLVYITPSHQYPTGAALSLERRIALLDWSRRNDSWIVEDDYDGEFGYDGQLLTPLYSIDTDSRVLYIGTLNKAMFASLRLAYAIVPERLVELLANIRTQLDGFTPAVTQMAMSLFMEEGFFSVHLRRMRALYKAKRTALIEALSPLVACRWQCPTRPAGMHLVVRHQDGGLVRALAEASSLDLALLSSYRITRASGDGLFLRYGALEISSLQAGAASLVATAARIRR